MTELTNCSAYVIANPNPNPNTETEPELEPESELEPELEIGRRRFGHEPRTEVRVRCMPTLFYKGKENLYIYKVKMNNSFIFAK